MHGVDERVIIEAPLADPTLMVGDLHRLGGQDPRGAAEMMRERLLSTRLCIVSSSTPDQSSEEVGFRRAVGHLGRVVSGDSCRIIGGRVSRVGAGRSHVRGS